MAERTNKIRCLACGDEPESDHRHDLRWCKCGKVAADGGRQYLRRIYPDGAPEEHYEELSEGWE
jgi:DNA-directed RNA polymerase subunit N (RpoN/RPB10)